MIHSKTRLVGENLSHHQVFIPIFVAENDLNFVGFKSSVAAICCWFHDLISSVDLQVRRVVVNSMFEDWIMC